MHKKDIKSRRPQTTQKTQTKSNNSVNTRTNILLDKRNSYHRPTVSLGCIETTNTKESYQRLISQENEFSLGRVKNTNMSQNLIPLSFLDLKVFTESKQSPELLKWQQEYIPRVSTSNNSRKRVEVGRFEASREVSPCEYVLKPSKPNEAYPKSKNKIEELVLERSKPFLETKYNISSSSKSKYSRGKRAASLASIEDTKGNTAFSFRRPTLSPKNASINDIGFVNKTDAPRSGPYLKPQKKILVRKNFSFEVKDNEKGNTPQIKSKVNRQKEEISPHCQTPLVNRRLNKCDTAEKEGKNASLKSILGNVFNNPNGNEGNIGVSLSKIGKPTYSLKRTINISDENFKDPVNYILSMYKMGAEKSLQRAKVANQQPTSEIVNIL